MTLRFAASFTIVSNAIALMLALLLERTNRLNSFFRVGRWLVRVLDAFAARTNAHLAWPQEGDRLTPLI